MSEMESTIVIRAATEADLKAINDINNHYITNTHLTLDLEPLNMKQRKEWFKQYALTGRHRLLVASNVDGTLLGYCASAIWRPKAGYDPSVETRVYVHPDYVGRSIGKMMYTALFSELENEDVHRAYASITQPNYASEKLHEHFGFYRVAFFSEQARKFERYWDVAWLEKQL